MYYVEIQLASGNWVTVKGCKSYIAAEEYAVLHCNYSNWKIYEK